MSRDMPPSDHPVFPGASILPSDPRYPALIRGFNQRFIGEPTSVEVCGDTQQVLRAVQAAVDNQSRITVRAGGHCCEDFVTDNPGGVLLDLSPLSAVYQQDELFCIEAGCTLWNVYSQLYKQYGLTLPAGSCYSVGAGGHILGGGYGLLSRKYGLSVDYLWAVEVVHVSKEGKAEIITVQRNASDPHEQDLFWSHQGGGGGNFGIVTKYWFKELPAAPSMASLRHIGWDWSTLSQEHFHQLVNQYGRFFAQHNAVDSSYNDLFAQLHLTHHSAPQITLTIQYVGEHPEAIDDFLSFIEPEGAHHAPQPAPVTAHQLIAPTSATRKMPWLEATQTLDGSGPLRRAKYKSAYLLEPLPDEQINVLWQYLTDPQYHNPFALVQVDSYGGQINAVPSSATAIPQRSSILKLVYQTYWTNPNEDERHLQWMREFYTAMYGPSGPSPDGIVDGCSINYPDVDLVNWQRLYYKDNYPRLQQTKARWDPRNIFHHKQSIELPS